MADYNKIEKETSNYTKIDKKETEKGWFKQGWFTDWLKGLLYKKTSKDISVYTKVNKE